MTARPSTEALDGLCEVVLERHKLRRRLTLLDATGDVGVPIGRLAPRREAALHDLFRRERRVELRLLREVLERRVAATVDDADVGGLEPGEDTKEGGLADAVDAEQADPLATRDRDGDVIEEDVAPPRLCDPSGGKDGHDASLP